MASPQAVFVAECYAPASDVEATASGFVRVGAACEELRAAGAEVVYLGALVVPDDELAFHVFAAPDAGEVQRAGRRAGLRVERVVQSVAVCFGQARSLSLPVGEQVERPVAHAPGEIGP